jgi:hypothetical protein
MSGLVPTMFITRNLRHRSPQICEGDIGCNKRQRSADSAAVGRGAQHATRTFNVPTGDGFSSLPTVAG